MTKYNPKSSTHLILPETHLKNGYVRLENRPYAEVSYSFKCNLKKERKLKHVPLADITRVDANAFRDHLLERMLPNSVVRNVAVVKAAVNYVLSEHSPNIPNVFNGLKIKGAGASKDDRHPLTEADIAVAEPRFMGDPIAWALFATLVDTGARVAEVAKLLVQDVDLKGRSLRISPNTIRGLKTKGSDR